MSKEDKIKVDKIGLDPSNNVVFMKGTKKTILGEKDVYSVFKAPSNDMIHLYSLMNNVTDENNQFIKSVLDMTGEKIKELSIYPHLIHDDTLLSTLKLSDREITNVFPPTGTIYSIIGGGDILFDEGVGVSKKRYGKKNKVIKNIVDSIDFKDINSLSDRVGGLDNIDFDKGEYNKLEFFGQGTTFKLTATPFLPISLPSGIDHLLIYKSVEGDTDYGFTSPEDPAILINLIQKASEHTESRQGGEYKLMLENAKKQTLRNLSVIKEILKKEEYKVEIYVNGKPVRPLNETTTLYEPEYAIIDVKGSNKIKTLRCPGTYAVAFGFLYSDSLFLKEEDIPNSESQAGIVGYT